jgi:hypothetical protein
MKSTKMSLANIQGKLSWIEIKNIMAVSGPPVKGCLSGVNYFSICMARIVDKGTPSQGANFYKKIICRCCIY